MLIEVPEPHEYTVWQESGSEFEGEWYTNSKRPQDFRVRVFEETKGLEVRAQPYFGATSSTGQQRRISMASFDAPAPGRYRVEVSGEFQKQVLERAQSVTPEGVGLVNHGFGMV